jgi:POT family proton-dependent oligopeptide transporter
MTIGDNLVYPIGNSITAELAPKSYETQMQSAWSQSASIGNAITMILFKFFTTADAQLKIFPIMAVVLAVTSGVLFLFSKNIEKGMVE